MERVQVVGVKQVVDALVVVQAQHVVIAEQRRREGDERHLIVGLLEDARERGRQRREGRRAEVRWLAFYRGADHAAATSGRGSAAATAAVHRDAIARHASCTDGGRDEHRG